MKILIVSDAGFPQTNGVVRTLEATARVLRAMGHDVAILTPSAAAFFSVPMPCYPEISLVVGGYGRVAAFFARFQPEIVHIATEGPLGWAARRYCLRQKKPFTTAYHTQFPEYIAARGPGLFSDIVKRAVYALLRYFHAPSQAVLVPTASMQALLTAKGFARVCLWPRGVDCGLFRPSVQPAPLYAGLQRPLLLYVGRVAVEKNLPAFLDLEIPGTKIVVGAGPDLEKLRARYPTAFFTGAVVGEALARYYAGADLFVFPSRTDTLGLVLLEAAASGLRLAAYPVTGPKDLFASAETQAFAVLDSDLAQAVKKALLLPRCSEKPRAFAEKYSWEASTALFLALATRKTGRGS